MIIYPGVKINRNYQDELLSQQLLPRMRDVLGEFFIFQQDSPPLCTGHATLYDFSSRRCLLSFHRICSHRTVLTLTLSTTRYGASSSSKSISHRCKKLMNWSRTCCMHVWPGTDQTIW